MAPSVPPYLPVASSYVPTHNDLFHVSFADGDFASSLITQKAFAKNETLCLIVNTLPGIKAYSSVQVLPDPALPNSTLTGGEKLDPAGQVIRHMELNSDLLYVNHSCDPNVAFDVPNGGPWKVRALTDLPAGTVLTFAYFSTEWFMDQPFECLCKTSRCLKMITGARDIDEKVLATYQINQHIIDLKRHQSSATTLASTTKTKVIIADSVAA